MSRLPIFVVLAVLCAQLAPHGISRPAGWDDATHSRDAEPDYSRVFPADSVPRLDIIVTAADWQRVIDDMTSMAGAFGAQRQQMVAGGRGGATPVPDGNVVVVGVTQEAVAACSGRVVGDTCTAGTVTNGRCTQVGPATLACVGLPAGAGPGAIGGNPGGTIGGGNVGGNVGGGNAAGPTVTNPGRGANGADDVDIFPRTPVYVPADLRFDGKVFRHVGFRLKGNSSLSNSWRSGVDKLPFRLNIDYLEDDYPEIRDQTFFGFHNLSFSSNSNDVSFMRNRVTTDLFREAGVPAARTAYVRVFMDRGEGPFYMGLYTVAEVPDTPMLESMFGSDDGNLYKPVGTGGRWTQFFELSFPKKTNEAAADWTDIQDAIAVLNESRANAATWRSRLEARFEVNGFLRWLALNTVVGNFDAYGGLSAHNYYLYGSPRHRDRLFWIAWDHDLAMNGGGIGGGQGTPGGGIDLFLDGTAANWPLIRFLLDDPTYRAAYRRHVTELLATVFEPERVVARLRREQALITPYVLGTEGELTDHTFLTAPAQFPTAVSALESYVRSRHATAVAALAVAR